MTQPYRPATGRHTGHGGYIATPTRYLCASIRPTRDAAGRTYTASRGGGDMSDDARRLAVFGTLARSTRPLGLVKLERVRCECCGAMRSVHRVTPAGRLWIMAKRRARADRLVARIKLVEV